MEVTLAPLRDYVLVELKKNEESPVWVPDAAKPERRYGIVVALGPGIVEYGCHIKPVVELGDEVMLIMAGMGIPVPGLPDHMLVQEKQLCAITARKDTVH